jgi:Homeodomain-like domain
MVGSDPVRVENDLVVGAFGCRSCPGVLGPWGFARCRSLRGDEGPVIVRPRRGRCRSCRSTHVLLPDVALLRRVDTVAVIGRAVTASAAGAGHRRIADELGRPPSTVRGWLRRFVAAAGRIAAHFTVWAHRLDPNLGPISPAGGRLGDAVEAIGVAARAASLRLGLRPPWSWAAVLTFGRLLCNTSSPWLAP